MALHSTKLPFTDVSTSQAPKQPGVFVLWEKETAVFAGKSANDLDTLHAAIRRHFDGLDEPNAKIVTHFSYEVALNPQARHFKLVLEFSAGGHL
jgi:hypothetical protein